MRDIDLFAQGILEAAVKIGTPQGAGGVADAVAKPEFAVAVGLALFAAEDARYAVPQGKKPKKSLKSPTKSNSNPLGFIKKIFNKF